MELEIRPELIDEMVEMYIRWREECLTLRRAYEHWSSLPVAERALPFAAYRAALDREEQASAAYAVCVNRLAHEPAGAPELSAVA